MTDDLLTIFIQNYKGAMLNDVFCIFILLLFLTEFFVFASFFTFCVFCLVLTFWLNLFFPF